LLLVVVMHCLDSV